MAFSSSSMYPKGLAYYAIGAGAQTTIASVTAAGPGTLEKVRKINWILLSSSSAAVVTIRAIDDSPNYMIVNLAANAPFVVPSFSVPDGTEGVEILNSGAATLNATVAWFV